MKPLEEEVIETLCTEEEYVSQWSELVRRRYRGELSDSLLMRALNDIHESAHCAVLQRRTLGETNAGFELKEEGDEHEIGFI